MPFLGTTPTQGFVSSFPKQSFTPDGSTTVFTLTNPVATANDLEVFVGNVRQEPTAAYSAAGTTLTMTEAPDAGLNFYVINKSFAQVTTNTPDNSVSTAKIVNDAVTTAKLGAGAVDTTALGANAVTSAKLFSTFENGIEFFETYRLAANTSATSSNDFTQSFTLASNRSYGALVPGGTGMSYSSGIWTFPATGMYLVHMHFRCYRNGTLDYMEVFGNVTTNNSSYNEAMNAMMGWGNHNATTYQSCDNWCIFDVTDTSTHKMKFTWAGSHSVAFAGGNTNASNITFMRIGDT